MTSTEIVLLVISLMGIAAIIGRFSDVRKQRRHIREALGEIGGMKKAIRQLSEALEFYIWLTRWQQTHGVVCWPKGNLVEMTCPTPKCPGLISTKNQMCSVCNYYFTLPSDDGRQLLKLIYWTDETGALSSLFHRYSPS